LPPVPNCCSFVDGWTSNGDMSALVAIGHRLSESFVCKEAVEFAEMREQKLERIWV